MDTLIRNIKQCRVCEIFLDPKPIFSVSKHSKIIVIGQAPGSMVHKTGIPWNDKSGDNLRNWLGVEKHLFYDPQNFGIMPMGFCFPGTGKSGDLPPRHECAPLWHDKLLSLMNNSRLILLIGLYAQNYYLGDKAKGTLTETVHCFKDYLPKYFPLPHPSPRNNIWQSKNEWFGRKVIPQLRKQVKFLIS